MDLPDPAEQPQYSGEPTLFWNPQHQQKREDLGSITQYNGRDEAKREHLGELKTLAKNRTPWCCFIDALCSAKK